MFLFIDSGLIDGLHMKLDLMTCYFTTQWRNEKFPYLAVIKQLKKN